MTERKIKEVLRRLEVAEAKLEEHRRATRDLIAAKVEEASLRINHGVTEIANKAIDARLSLTYKLVTLLFLALGTVSYFGISKLVSEAIETEVSRVGFTRLEMMSQQAEAHLAAIERARASSVQPLIVLQTDYGSESYYVGRMKGVIYNADPNARIEEITSDVAAFDVVNAAFTLWRASRFYPAGTIFIVVTNPGGITTEMVVVQTDNDHIYIGHDNGCFDLVVEHYGHKATYRIASKVLTPPRFKDLFGGVDTLAPTAAKLAQGFPINEVGPRIEKYESRLTTVQHEVEAQRVVGTVMDIDKYGNVTTNIRGDDLRAIQARLNGQVRVEVEGMPPLLLPFKRTYGNVSYGEPVLLLYEDLVQLAINEGNFADAYSVLGEESVVVSPAD